MDRPPAIPIKLANGSSVLVEVFERQPASAEQDVTAYRIPALKDVLAPIEGLSDEVLQVLKSTGPTKAAIEFGIEVGLEAGQLTALLVKGTGTANLKVTLEWEKAHDSPVTNTDGGS